MRKLSPKTREQRRSAVVCPGVPGLPARAVNIAMSSPSLRQLELIRFPSRVSPLAPPSARSTRSLRVRPIQCPDPRNQFVESGTADSSAIRCARTRASRRSAVEPHPCGRIDELPDHRRSPRPRARHRAGSWRLRAARFAAELGPGAGLGVRAPGRSSSSSPCLLPFARRGGAVAEVFQHRH